jgi:tetratricopeptide (TPR) repeat protein
MNRLLDSLRRFFGRARPGSGGRGVRDALPPVLDAASVRAHLSKLTDRGRGNEATTLESLDSFAAALRRTGNPVLESLAVTNLADRLMAAPPNAAPERSAACLDRIETLLVPGRVDDPIVRLQLAGAGARLKGRMRPRARGARPAHAASPVLRANELLAASIRGASLDELVEAGAAYLEAEEAALAERCLSRADERGDADGRAAFLLGQCAFRDERYDRASEMFGRAVSRGWNRGDVTRWQATALFEIGRNDEAESFAQAALAVADEATRPQMLTVLGKIGLARGATAEAGALFDQALSAAPGLADAAYGRGLCALADDDLATAEARFEQVRTMDGGAGLASMGLGFVAAARGDAAAGVRNLTDALSHFPSHAQAHLGIASCHFDAGAYDDALDHFTRARALGADDPASRLRFGLAALALGDVENACEILRRCTDNPAALPFLVAALQRASAIALDAGDFEVALSCAEESLRWAPPSAQDEERLALMLYAASRQDMQAGAATEDTAARFERAAEALDTPATRAGAVMARIMRREPLSEEMLAALEGSGEDSEFAALTRLVAAYARKDAAAIAAAAGQFHPSNDVLAAFRALAAVHGRLWSGSAAERPGAEDGAALAKALAVPGFDTAFETQRESANRVIVSLLFECQRRRRAEVVQRQIDELARAAAEGYWSDADVLCRLLRLSRLDQAVFTEEAARTAERCRRNGDGGSALHRRVLGVVERAVVARQLAKREYAEASGGLERLIADDAGDAGARAAVAAIAEVLQSESHESASLARAANRTERARDIWARLVHAGDVDAAHHLAVSLFSQAYDDATEGSGAAAAAIASALPFWKAVHESDGFWSRLRAACEQQHSNKYPFRPELFDKTRADLPFDALAALGELAARAARAGDREGAKACVAALHGSPFGEALARRVLDEVFAERLLPRTLPGTPDAAACVAMLAAAELVLGFDSQNQRALHALLYAAYSHAAVFDVGGVSADAAANVFGRAYGSIERLPDSAFVGSPQLVSARKAFWREFSRVLFAATNDLVGEHNQAQESGRQSQLSSVLRRLRHHVDFAFNVIRPACEQWTPGEANFAIFENVDPHLTRNNLPPTRATRW